MKPDETGNFSDESQIDHAAKGSVVKRLLSKFFRTENFELGLPGRLLSLTIVFVLVAEFLIFLPSVSKFRTNWLNERVQAAEIAAIALEVAPNSKLSDGLSERLLNETQLLAVAMGDEDMWELVFSPKMPITSTPVVMDLRKETGLQSFLRTIGHATAKEGRILRILSKTGMERNGRYLDIFVPESALRSDLLDYALNILFLSLLISGVTGALISWSLFRLVVKPMMKITTAVADFGEAPEKQVAFKASGRNDEIGKAENALIEMQETVSNSFRQKRRLAELGEAVAKISHDLRNSLSVARLASDSLRRSNDPRVQSAAPRLERAIERAIGLAEETLRYGKADAPKVNLAMINLRNAVEDAMVEGVSSNTEIDWLNDVDEDLSVYADGDVLHRLIANLVRNSGQAITQEEGGVDTGLIRVAAERSDDWLEIIVEDNGPGIPDHVQEKLFKPFSVSESRGGTGLGLAITRELAQSMGGSVRLQTSSPKGTTFVVKLQAIDPTSDN